VALNAYRTGLAMSTKSTASFIKTKLAESLRKNPYQVNLLVGGFDKGQGPSLYYIDYLGAMAKMPYASHGYAAYFLFSTMDCAWKPGMNEAEALALARLCVAELAKRFTIHQPNWVVKVACAEGVRELKL
jgi:20S proteasome subunit beta 4